MIHITFFQETSKVYKMPGIMTVCSFFISSKDYLDTSNRFHYGQQAEEMNKRYGRCYLNAGSQKAERETSKRIVQNRRMAKYAEESKEDN
jgi:hypothetical protein